MKHLFRVLLKVVHRVAQAGLLRVVDVDHIIAGSNRQRILIHAVVIVAVDINHFVRRRDHILERHPALNLCIVKHLFRVLINVIHRVAQVVPLRVVDVDHILAGSNLQRFRRQAVVVVAVNRDLFILRLDHSPERLIPHGLCVKHLVRALLKVVHRVAQVGLLRKLRRERRILIQRIGSCVCRFFLQLAVDVIQVIICLTIISFPTDKLISSIRRRNRNRQTPTVRKVARHRLNLVCSAVRNRSAFAGSIGNVNGLFFVRLIVHVNGNRVVSDCLIHNFPNVFITFKFQRLSFGLLAILLIFCFFFQNYFRRRLSDDMLDRIRHVDLFEINNAVHMPREYRFRLIVICASGELVSCPSHIAKRNQFIVFPWN